MPVPAARPVPRCCQDEVLAIRVFLTAMCQLCMQNQRVLKRDFKQQRTGGWDKQPRPSGDGYEGHVLENAEFEEYYRGPGVDCWDRAPGACMCQHACRGPVPRRGVRRTMGRSIDGGHAKPCRASCRRGEWDAFIGSAARAAADDVPRQRQRGASRPTCATASRRATLRSCPATSRWVFAIGELHTAWTGLQEGARLNHQQRRLQLAK